MGLQMSPSLQLLLWVIAAASVQRAQGVFVARTSSIVHSWAVTFCDVQYFNNKIFVRAESPCLPVNILHVLCM